MSQQTLAQQLGKKEFPFIKVDDRMRIIYYENKYNQWIKSEYDDNNRRIYREDQLGWAKMKYNDAGELIYYEDKDGVLINK